MLVERSNASKRSPPRRNGSEGRCGVESEPRTTCRDCGEELWGSDEAHGLCGRCQMSEDIATGRFDDPRPDGEDGEPEEGRDDGE